MLLEVKYSIFLIIVIIIVIISVGISVGISITAFNFILTLAYLMRIPSFFDLANEYVACSCVRSATSSGLLTTKPA